MRVNYYDAKVRIEQVNKNKKASKTANGNLS